LSSGLVIQYQNSIKKIPIKLLCKRDRVSGDLLLLPHVIAKYEKSKTTISLTIINGNIE
jgi:hypothetical protein